MKKKEYLEERIIVARNTFRYDNLMKVKTKVEMENHFEITFNSVAEYENSVKEYKVTFILPK